MQMAPAGDAFDLMHVERRPSPGTVGRENRRSSARGSRPHPSPALQAHDLCGRHVNRRHSAIWRLISSRIEIAAIADVFHRAAVHHREIVAELAGKVEILLDQHDRDAAQAAQIEIARPISLMIDGWMPSVGSSSSSSFGRITSARPIASCCCWPPDRSPPRRPQHRLAAPETARTRRPGCCGRRASAAPKPVLRFSSTVSSGKISRPCGTKAMPRRARS